METNNKILFWDRIFNVMVISFVISMGLVFVLPEIYFDNSYFLYPWLIVFFIGCICEIVFTLGMTYNAYKMKRYGWMLCVLLLGDIFMILFYFRVLKKYLNGDGYETQN